MNDGTCTCNNRHSAEAIKLFTCSCCHGHLHLNLNLVGQACTHLENGTSTHHVYAAHSSTPKLYSRLPQTLAAPLLYPKQQGRCKHCDCVYCACCTNEMQIALTVAHSCQLDSVLKSGFSFEARLSALGSPM